MQSRGERRGVDHRAGQGETGQGSSHPHACLHEPPRVPHATSRPRRLCKRGPDDILGGPGGDNVHAGGGDTVDGGDGDDQIHSDSGRDRIAAGGGDDVVHVDNGTAVRSVDCGPGSDTIHINPYGSKGGISNAQAVRSGRIRDCAQVVESAPVADPTKGATRQVRSDGGGSLTGTERNDVLLGHLGPDRLRGEAGDDTLQDGPGSNRIDAGPGADRIRLRGSGSNSVQAGGGDDTVLAYSRRSTRTDCGPGTDTVQIGPNRGVKLRGCERVSRRRKDR